MISSRQHVFVPSVSSCFLIAKSLFHGDFVVFYVRFDAILSFIFSLQQIVVLALSSLLQLANLFLVKSEPSDAFLLNIDLIVFSSLASVSFLTPSFPLQLLVLAPVISKASSVSPLVPIPVAFFFLLNAFRSFVFSLQRVSSHSPVSHPLLLTLTPVVTRQVFIFRFKTTLPSGCVPLYAS